MYFKELNGIFERLSASVTDSEVFQNFIFEVTSSFDFLFLHSRENDDCRYIVVKNIQNNKRSCEEETFSEPDKSELIGSPLKFNYESIYPKIDSSLCNQEDVKNNEEYKAVDLKSARWLISLYNQCHGLKSILPIVVLCDGVNEGVVLISSKFVDHGFTLINMTLESFEKFCPKVGKLDCLKKQHLYGLHQNKIDNIEVRSDYDFSGSCAVQRREKSKIKIMATFKWSTCSELLELPPKRASCELKVTKNDDEHECVISGFAEEIKSLENLILGDFSSISEADLTEMKGKLLHLLTDLKTMSLYSKLGESENDPEKKFILLAVPVRKFDLTDYLWNFLKTVPQHCHSLLKFLLLNEHLKEIKHMIFKTNKTKLAEIIREQNSKQILPSEKDSLEILIEIGLQKLQRDYVNFFKVSELASREKIELIFYGLPDNKTKLDKMKMLQTSLDIILSCVITLEMPREYQSKFVNQVLGMRDPQSNSFCYHIPCDIMMRMLKNHIPQHWQINFTSTEVEFKKTTIHQFSSKCLIPWVPVSNMKFHHLITTKVSDCSLLP